MSLEIITTMSIFMDKEGMIERIKKEEINWHFILALKRKKYQETADLDVI